MKRLVSWLPAFLLLLVVAPNAGAQSKLGGLFAVGASTVSGDLSDVDSTKTGWQVMLGAEYALVDKVLSLRVDGTFGKNERISLLNESAYMYGISARLEYWTPIKFGNAQPYLMGSAGLLGYKYNPGQSGRQLFANVTKYTMMGGGAGINYTIGSAVTFLEGRFETGDNRTIVPIVLGLRWNGK